MSKVFTIFLSLVLILTNGCNNSSQAQKIRKAGVAGAFYPADKNDLKKVIKEYLAGAQSKKISSPVTALIAPHAGYVYSGHVAAESYAQLKDREIERAIVLAPSHVEYFQGASIFSGDAYETPIGQIKIDKKFAAELCKNNQLIFLSEQGHALHSSGRPEHSLEIQLPFLQEVLGEFELVPIVLGDQSWETCRELAYALADAIKDDKTIIIASTDLSHFHSYDEAVSLDRKVIHAVSEWDYYNLSRNLQARIWEACGGGPVVTAMMAAEKLGANKAVELKYANSGDVSIGDRSRVVGYVSIALVKSDEPPAEKEFMLNSADRKTLLAIAKNVVEEKVKHNRTFEPETDSPALLQARGAFVTLNKNHNLRGCIGYTSPMKALYLTVRDMAVSAAVHDRRFAPVGEEELDKLEYDISVLSPFKRVLDIKKIEVGKHGLLIKNGRNSGLLLPQVSAEYGWDRETFLQQTCRKAGLSINAWQDENSDVFSFTAFVFSE